MDENDNRFMLYGKLINNEQYIKDMELMNSKIDTLASQFDLYHQANNACHQEFNARISVLERKENE